MHTRSTSGLGLVHALGLALLVAAPLPSSGAQEVFDVGGAPEQALGTAFTYQGRLTVDGVAANGAYDFLFSLHDAAVGGTQVGTLPAINGVPVTRGLFAVVLDFGNAFSGGQRRWIEIAARPSGAGSFTPLTPRQEIAPSPYALYAQVAGAPWTLSGSAIFFTGGSVGIGTAPSAGFKLHVRGGNVRFDGGDLRFDAGRGLVSAGGAEIRTQDLGNVWQFFPSATGASGSSARFWSRDRTRGVSMDVNANIALDPGGNVILDPTGAIYFGSTCFRPRLVSGVTVLGQCQ